MRLSFQVSENPINILRRAGYVFQRKENDEMSFIRSLAGSGYPRFHIYVKLENQTMLLNLHFDEKKITYGNATRHHGEYGNSKILSEEAERLSRLILKSES